MVRKNNSIKAQNGTYMVLKLSELFVNSRVNRDPIAKHIAEMCGEKFNPKAVKAFVVSKQKNGTYSVLDGCQELHVLLKQGWTEHVCQVHEGLTFAEECKLFNLLNNHKTVQPNIKFRNSFQAKEQWAVDIYNILKRHDFNIVMKSGRPCKSIKNIIKGVTTLTKIVNTYTLTTLDSTLYLIRNVFEIAEGEVERNAYKDMFINGVAIFLNDYGIDVEEAVELLQGKEAYDIEQEAMNKFGDSRKGLDKFIARQLLAACGYTIHEGEVKKLQRPSSIAA
jgi:hypothetical protein